jgi:tetratricopeptide (TPR) repeat protein
VILHLELGPLDEAGRRLGARAGALLGGAGERALGRGDVDAAARLLKRALDVLPADAPPRLELTYALGAARAELGDLAGAERLLAGAAAGIDRWSLAARARLELAWVRCMLDPRAGMSELRRIANEITGSSAAAGDDVLLARAFHLSAVDLFGDERHGRAVAAFDRALTHARRAGDGRIEADALYLCGCATYFGPAPAGEVIPRWEALLDDSRHCPAVEAAAATGLALLSALQERFDEARRLIGRTFEIYDELGMAVHRAGSMYTLVEIELLAGDLDAAEAAAHSGHERFLSLGDQSFAAGGALYLAEIAEARGSFATAESLTATAEQLAGDDDTQTRTRAGPLRARDLARGGRFDEAMRLIGKAMAVLEESETPCRLGDALLDQAYVLRLAERRGDADDAVRRAHELFARKGNRPRTRRAHGLLADAERAAAAARQSG